MRLRLAAACVLAPCLALALAACGGGGGPAAPNVEMVTATDTNHVDTGTTVTYSSNPPAIGPHWPTAAAAGVYTTVVQPEAWVHSLEHGAIVFLYECPSGCPSVAANLVNYAAAVPASTDGRPFQYIVTPYTGGMSTRVAVVAWGWILRADDVDQARFDQFIAEHYRMAPEDFPLP